LHFVISSVLNRPRIRNKISFKQISVVPRFNLTLPHSLAYICLPGTLPLFHVYVYVNTCLFHCYRSNSGCLYTCLLYWDVYISHTCIPVCF